MKKLMIVLAAALFVGACHCQKCTKQACQPKPEPVVEAPAPAPAPKVEEDQAIAEVANVRQAANATVLSFKEPINFRYNSDEMSPESVATVDKVANALKNYPNAKVRVAGYTDSLGNPNYNIDLSERRAYTVASQLVKDGVPAENVSYIGYGAAHPIATNKTAEGRYQNRRVELEVTNY